MEVQMIRLAAQGAVHEQIGVLRNIDYFLRCSASRS